jgi:hypothetical protein
LFLDFFLERSVGAADTGMGRVLAPEQMISIPLRQRVIAASLLFLFALFPLIGSENCLTPARAKRCESEERRRVRSQSPAIHDEHDH